MINIRKDIVAAMRANAEIAALCGNRIYFAYLPVPATYPLITYREMNNRVAIIADCQEAASEIVIVVNAVTDKADQLSRLAAAVDAAMSGIGFVRDGANDMSEDGVYVKSMRYLIYKEVG